MGRKRRKGKSGSGKDNPGVSKVPAISFEIGEDADQAFIDAMKELDPSQIPGKDHLKDEDEKSRRPAATPRSKPGQPEFSIDLHGYTLSEAKDVVGSRLSQLIASQGGIIHIRIVTGKGRHSGREGSVLAREVHTYVVQRFQKFIQRIDSAPADVVVGDLPIRGHFDVVLRCL
jgi:DNA-nicking Smr family endonuclease